MNTIKSNKMKEEDVPKVPHADILIQDSSESDLSFSLSLELDREIELINCDELPVFDMRLISPLGRTPSPITDEDSSSDNSDSNITPKIRIRRSYHKYKQQEDENANTSPSCENNPEFVTLQEINAQISPPENENSISRTQSLETIFEGEVFTTPQRSSNASSRVNSARHSRSNSLLERATMNRLKRNDKENYSPTTLFGEKTPKLLQQCFVNAAKKLDLNDNDNLRLFENEN